MSEVSFKLKGSSVTVVVLALIRYEPETLKAALKAKIDQSPEFFANSPVLISLENFLHYQTINDFEPILAVCRELTLQPIGFSGLPEAHLPAAQRTGLAIIPSTRERALKLAEKSKEETAKRNNALDDAPPSHKPSLFITRPVRSGQQIYAEGTDLVIMSQVGEGAEVIADGHIHIYGPLRGRALAGVRGNSQARIFCQSMEAELVSINGDFILKDAFDENVIKQPTQVYLSDDTMHVERLSS